MFRIGSYKNTPVLYRLAIADKGRTLLIKIWKHRWIKVKIYLEKNIALQEKRRRNNNTLLFGSSSVFKIDEDSDEYWVVIRCKLPSAGSKEDSFTQTLHAIQIIEPLNYLFSALYIVLATDPSDSFVPQSVELSVFYNEDRRLFGMSACLGQEIRTWVETNILNGVQSRISSVMNFASEYMNPGHAKSETFVRIPRDRRIIFHTWGDACDLSVYEPDACQFGLELNCHNLDSPFQPLIFMVGLASLCTEFEESQA